MLLGAPAIATRSKKLLLVEKGMNWLARCCEKGVGAGPVIRQRAFQTDGHCHSVCVQTLGLTIRYLQQPSIVKRELHCGRQGAVSG